MNTEKTTKLVRVEDIIPNRFQPRLNFEMEGLNELAESIKTHGIIQPLVLRKIGNKFEIIAGERRYKASLIAGLNEVPAVIVDLNDSESAEVALVENIQRRELSPIEEARSYKNIIDLGGLKQDELAKRMGKNQSTVSNKLRLLNLAEEVQDALLTGQISERHARSLLSLKEQNKQIAMLKRIIDNRLTVRQTDDEIYKINNNLMTLEVEEADDEEIMDIIDDEESDEGQVLVNPFMNQVTEPVSEVEQQTVSFNPFANQINNIEEKPEEIERDNNNIVPTEPNEIELPVSPEISNEPFVPQNTSYEQLSNPFNINNEVEEKEEEKVEAKPGKYFNFSPFASQTPVQELEPITPKEDSVKLDPTNPMDRLPNYNGEDLYVPEGNVPLQTANLAFDSLPTSIATPPASSNIDPNNFSSIIKAFRDLIDEIEDLDYIIDEEETDFQEYYQFNIKIDKERLS